MTLKLSNLPKRIVKFCFFFACILLGNSVGAQTDTVPSVWVFENNVHVGGIVRNAPEVPYSKMSGLLEVNPGVQTMGGKEWQQLLGFPKVACSFVAGSVGNTKELGYLFGILPNMTFNSVPHKWYSPSVRLGLGISYFNSPYNAVTHPKNLYIGSHLTAFALASVFIKPRLNDHLDLTAGISVMHSSNGHYQIPNLGMNIPSVSIGLNYHPKIIPNTLTRKTINVPSASTHLNFRFGLGVHELAKTTEPIGTPKYAIYVTDIYLSKRYGKISNVHLGVEVNYYKSYYQYIVDNDFYASDRHWRSCSVNIYLAHELMMHKFSVLAQGGIYLYNKFYRDYLYQFKSERGFKNELKKIFPTRLGVHYYFLDPEYCTRSNVFIGAYIKANFGQADFICAQMGVVF